MYACILVICNFVKHMQASTGLTPMEVAEVMQWQFIVTSLVEWPKHAFYQSWRKQRIKAGMKNLSGSAVSLEVLRYM